MFCPKCGAELPEDAKFCIKCGAKQPEKQTVAQPQYQAPKQEKSTAINQSKRADKKPDYQFGKGFGKMAEEEMKERNIKNNRIIKYAVGGIVGFCVIVAVLLMLIPEPETSGYIPISPPSEQISSESTAAPATPEPTEDLGYTESYATGELFLSTVEANEARYIAEHEGESIRIGRFEITGIQGDTVYNYSAECGYIFIDFGNASDLYSINEGDLVTIDAVVSADYMGDMRLIDCVLISVDSSDYSYSGDELSDEFGLHTKADGSSSIGYGIYTAEGGGFTLTYFGTDTTGSNMIFSASTPYSNSSDNGTLITFYDDSGNSLLLRVITPGTISISCNNNYFGTERADVLNGTYYMTQAYINPAG